MTDSLARTEQLKKDVTLEITASYFSQKQGRRVRVRAPVKKKFWGPPARAARLKIFTLNLTVIAECFVLGLKRSTCTSDKWWILPRKKKSVCDIGPTGSPSGRPGPANFYRLPPRLVRLPWTCLTETSPLKTVAR